MLRNISAKDRYLYGKVKEGFTGAIKDSFFGVDGSATAFLVGLNRLNRFLRAVESFLGLK